LTLFEQINDDDDDDDDDDDTHAHRYTVSEHLSSAFVRNSAVFSEN